MTGTIMGLASAILVQGALALGLIWYLGVIRVPLIMSGKVAVRDIALARDPWPDREKQVSNAVDNQFQLPVLFFVAAILALNSSASIIDVLLAWAFVISRLVHAYIHITDNNVVRRFWAYTIGLALLSIFWLVVAIRITILVVLRGAY